MIIPYHEELEQQNRTFHLKVGTTNMNKTYDQDIYLPILSQYLSTKGILIECTTPHKNNNMIHKYFEGIDLLKRANAIDTCKDNEKLKIVNEKYLADKYGITAQNLTIPKEIKEKLENTKNGLSNIDCYIEERNRLRKEISKLEDEKDKEMYDVYCYFESDQRLRFCLVPKRENIEKKDYDNESIKKMIALLHGYVDIMNTFIDLSKYAKEEGIKFIDKFDYNDFLVQLIGLDKVENKWAKTITTSRLNINETFFNYKIMDWNIKQMPRFVINKEEGKIKLLDQSNFLRTNSIGNEREYEEEINLIKKKVPYNERHKYLIK